MWHMAGLRHLCRMKTTDDNKLRIILSAGSDLSKIIIVVSCCMSRCIMNNRARRWFQMKQTYGPSGILW